MIDLLHLAGTEPANVQLHVMEEETPSYSPVCPPNPPVVLTWENLTVSSKETSSEVRG